MRRLVPWALVGLIGLGAILGAALGAARSPGPPGPSPQQWIAGVVATTRAAGTAQLGSSIIVTSPDSALRSWANGAGVVDFATRSYRVRTTSHQTEWSSDSNGPLRPRTQTTTDGEIAIGKAVYQNLSLPGFQDSWTKEPVPRNFGELGLASAGVFGAVLSPFSRPFTVVGVTALGPAQINDAPATRYVVTSQLAPDCPTAGPPQLRRDRTTVWVDGRGRLVQVRLLSFFNGKLPASLLEKDPAAAAQPLGPMTITITLRLSAFGAPVHIAAPTVGGGRSFTVGAVASSTSVARCG